MKEFKQMVKDTIIEDSAGFIIGVAITSISFMLFSGISDLIIKIILIFE